MEHCDRQKVFINDRLESFGAMPTQHTDDIAAAAVRLRLAVNAPLPRDRNAGTLSQACQQISQDSPAARETIRTIADHWGWSKEIVQLSLHKLTEPFRKEDDLKAFTRIVRPGRKLIGFVMAGNIPGAGLHELIAAMLAGCAVMIKTATAEPIFFARFAKEVTDLDQQIGARIAVFNWPRGRADLTAAMRESCDVMVVFGDDGTIAQLQSLDGLASGAEFTGFGARVSGVVAAHGALQSGAEDFRSLQQSILMDVIAFEQRGCLSPHHVFVEDDDGEQTRKFAEWLARNHDSMVSSFPPPHSLNLEDAAAIRRAREIARWRAIGGHNVQLWERPLPGATVIYDRDASFVISPGFRTLHVSLFKDPADLERRLKPVRGRVEAFAMKFAEPVDSPARVAEIRRVLERTGATHICEPGQMQSPPLDWPHGGGAFLRMLIDDK